MSHQREYDVDHRGAFGGTGRRLPGFQAPFNSARNARADEVPARRGRVLANRPGRRLPNNGGRARCLAVALPALAAPIGWTPGPGRPARLRRPAPPTLHVAARPGREALRASGGRQTTPVHQNTAKKKKRSTTRRSTRWPPGQRGVLRMLSMLHTELETAMRLAGVTSLAQLRADAVVRPVAQ